MGIAINQTFARIGIERTPSRLEIESKNARLEFHRRPDRISMQTQMPRIEIEPSDRFVLSDLKRLAELNRDIVQQAYHSVMEYIGKIASDGDMLAAIEKGGEPIADIAERDAYPERESGVDYIPRDLPRFNVIGGVSYEVVEGDQEGIRNGVECRYVPWDLKIKYTPSNIRIYMEQYNSVKISYNEPNVDLRL